MAEKFPEMQQEASPPVSPAVGCHPLGHHQESAHRGILWETAHQSSGKTHWEVSQVAPLELTGDERPWTSCWPPLTPRGSRGECNRIGILFFPQEYSSVPTDRGEMSREGEFGDKRWQTHTGISNTETLLGTSCTTFTFLGIPSFLLLPNTCLLLLLPNTVDIITLRFNNIVQNGRPTRWCCTWKLVAIRVLSEKQNNYLWYRIKDLQKMTHRHGEQTCGC